MPGGLLRTSRSLPELATLVFDYPPLPRSPSNSPPPDSPPTPPSTDIFDNTFDANVSDPHDPNGKGEAREDVILFNDQGRHRDQRDPSEEYASHDNDDDPGRTMRRIISRDEAEEEGTPLELPDALTRPILGGYSFSPVDRRLRALSTQRYQQQLGDEQHQESADDDYRSPSPLSSNSSSPSPSSPSAFIARLPPSPPLGRKQRNQIIPFSLWDYLTEEVLAVEMDGEEGVKSERVTNFLTVPGEVEKVSVAGCLDCCWRMVLRSSE